MEKKMENEMETGIIQGSIGMDISQTYNGGFLMKEYIWNYTKLQEESLCSSLMVPWTTRIRLTVTHITCMN